MDFDKFKNANELKAGLKVGECKEKIVKMVKELEAIDKQLDAKEKLYIEETKINVGKFLTGELNFIEEIKGNEFKYSFKNGDDNYRVEIKYNVDSSKFLTIIKNGKQVKEARFDSTFKNDINFDSIEWELENIGYFNSDEYELKRKHGIKPQDTIEFWNRELELVQESYEKNIKEYNKIEHLFGAELFVIEQYTDGDSLYYDALEELIQSEFKTI